MHISRSKRRGTVARKRSSARSCRRYSPVSRLRVTLGGSARRKKARRVEQCIVSGGGCLVRFEGASSAERLPSSDADGQRRRPRRRSSRPTGAHRFRRQRCRRGVAETSRREVEVRVPRSALRSAAIGSTLSEATTDGAPNRPRDQPAPCRPATRITGSSRREWRGWR